MRSHQSSLDLNDLPSILVGVSGEYFAAAELSRRGYIASVYSCTRQPRCWRHSIISRRACIGYCMFPSGFSA